MEIALEEARAALSRGEVPVGCAILDEHGKLLAKAGNRTNELCDGSAHAELLAFRDMQAFENEIAAHTAALYVTCEPCIMCASAIVQSALFKTVVYGCNNTRFGGVHSVRTLQIYQHHSALQIPLVISDVQEEQCMKLLELFYESENPNAPAQKRKKRRNKKGQHKKC